MTRLLAILTTLALVLAACAGAPGTSTTGGAATATQTIAKVTSGGTITFALENDVSNLDPMLSGLFVDRNIHYAMYDSLVRVTPQGEIIPWLAEKWTPSADGKSWTFNLRQGVKYHDGSTFDAASGIRSAADIIPGVRDLNIYALGDALTFGAILGFLAAIFGGWLGGLLAPTQVVASIPPVRQIPAKAPATVARTTERREVVTERPRRMLPAFGRKGGEHAQKDEVRTSQVEQRVDRS